MTIIRFPRPYIFEGILLLVLFGLPHGEAAAQATAAGQSFTTTSVTFSRETIGAPLFAPVVTYDPGGAQASMVTVADVNGDDKPDLVVVNCGDCYVPPSIGHDGSVAIMLGNGDGTLQPPVTYPTAGATPLFATVADFNGDGRLDIAVVNRCQFAGCLNESVIGVLLGNGNGSFQVPVAYGTGGLFPTSVAAADLSGDGALDLVVSNRCADPNCDGSVGVLRGNGDGTFQAAATYPTGGNDAFALTIADVNADGTPDVAVTTQCIGTSSCGAVVSVLLGNHDGTLRTAVLYKTGGGFGAAVVIADVNGDDKPDVVVESIQCCGSANGVAGVLLGNGDGTFQTVVLYKTGDGGWGTSVAVADVNADGIPDLVATDQCAGANCLNRGLVAVLLGNGNGTFQAAVTYSAGGFLTHSIAVADMNGDRQPDLLLANQCADDSARCLLTTVAVLVNNSTPLDTIPPTLTISVSPRRLWPPNGKWVRVTVSGAVTDSGSGVDARSAAYMVIDEYGEVQPRGEILVDSVGRYSFTILLRARRSGDDTNGRVYTIRVSASDNAGHPGDISTTVTVPHDAAP